MKSKYNNPVGTKAYNVERQRAYEIRKQRAVQLARWYEVASIITDMYENSGTLMQIAEYMRDTTDYTLAKKRSK